MTTARQLEQPVTNLYDVDFLAWIEAQAQALRTRKASSLDWDNILEELESMGRSEKNALRSHLRILLMHLMKWQWQPQKQSKSWATTIRNQRLDLKYLIKDSPSLKRLIPEILPDAWGDAADDAAFETGLPISTFPELCPWDIDTQILAKWWPE
ncbi:MAG: DUF29 domain-containing protein [Acidithiobacillus sp.]|jgi:hypothetical protein|uniref:DUF29 domain-containing protein n=1 Tax=Acidithiobacillus sp. TaxID=1872118 RepID=UPI0029FE8D31|nr:DUF29 domain-containing protein [Acidithiobacillus ferrooxidans]MDD5002731.1 DUF29 domain-containing protein [Acidithiobacillus sp.]MDD5379780.1 DUF29 domain-containing protein [Acidithiobacillus sp.]MDD5577345.1 DUF29 domain-containing protein [Acidithiobacillus sp.]